MINLTTSGDLNSPKRSPKRPVTFESNQNKNSIQNFTIQIDELDKT